MFINFTSGNWSREFWIAIIMRQYEINDSSLAWLGWTVQLLEMLSMLITKVFGHPNVTRIMLAFLLDGYILAVSRTYLLAYQFSHPYVLQADPELGYPRPIEFDFWLLLGTFLRQYYLYSTLLSMVIVVFERAFAFYYLEDYEKNRRRWIETVLLTTKMLSCSIMAILNFMGWVANSYAVLLCMWLFILAIAGFARLHVLNKRKYYEIKNMRVQSRYTLSLRYQIMENERVLRMSSSSSRDDTGLTVSSREDSLEMISVVFYSMIVCGVVQLALALATSAFIPLSSSSYDFFQAAFETSVAITPNIVVVAAISQIPGAWAGLKRRAMRRTATVEPVVMNAPSRGEDQMKLYFQQLSQSWQ